MELDRITTRVRPRERWEAADLGLLMARAWWGRAVAAALALTLPLFLVLWWFASPWWALLAIWWLKPLWERPILFIASRALFGHLPRFAETMAALPRLLRGAVGSVLWRRFEPSRSMNLPVLQLEGLSGEARRRRLRLLHGRGSAGGWLTLLLFLLEVALVAAALLLLSALVPPALEERWTAWLAEPENMGRLVVLAGYGAMVAVAPFHVMAGFSLYLHRRVWLEGWDIEIAFRRLRQRLSPPAAGRAALWPLLLVAGFATIAAPHAEAQEPTPEQARETVRQIVSQPPFFHVESEPRIVWPWERGEEEREEEGPRFGWLRQLVEHGAELARVLLWVVALAGVVWVALRYRHWARRERARPERRVAPPPPATLFGLDVTPASLPRHVAGEAATLWRSGRRREALALLYRATLARLMADHGLRFEEGATEGECLRRIEARCDPALGDYFALLAGHWRRTAYGHRPPSDEEAEGLWRRWSALFGEERDGD